jgi:hypothetical protein
MAVAETRFRHTFAIGHSSCLTLRRLQVSAVSLLGCGSLGLGHLRLALSRSSTEKPERENGRRRKKFRAAGGRRRLRKHIPVQRRNGSLITDLMEVHKTLSASIYVCV